MTRTSDIPTIDAATARRLLMHAQGLLQDPDRPATARSVYAQIERMGFVQLDSISVVERAHHHILHSRFDRYTPRVLARLHEEERSLFEHMTHDASLIPTRWFPHWKHRFSRAGRSAWWEGRLGKDRDATIRAVLERIGAQGAAMSKHFASESGGNGTWWEWGPHKAALEYLWRAGVVMVAARVNFHKVYDLTERVLPEGHASPTPTREEHVDWACRTAIERLVVATPGEVAAFWHSISPRDAANWCRDAIARGELTPVRVAPAGGARPRASLALPDWSRRAASLPEAPARMRLLSPFDPVIRDRKRLERLFGFEYRFEAFVPAAKRRYGYFVLPILEGDRLVGRLNPRMDRERGRLDVLGVWWEPGVRQTRERRAALAEALDCYAAFNGADSWRLANTRG